MTQKMALKEQLKKRILLMDGAMGTYYSRLYPDAGEAECANVTEVYRGGSKIDSYQHICRE